MSISFLTEILAVLDFSSSAFSKLEELLQLTCGMEGKFPATKTPVELLHWLRDLTQRNFLRRVGSERWEMQENPLYEKNQEKIRFCLAELGFIDAQLPSARSYDHIAILSTTAKKFEDRLEFLSDLFRNHGLTAQAIHLVGSSRPLLVDQEKGYLDKLGKDAKELDMLVDLYTEFQRQHRLPQGIPFYPVDTPLLIDGFGKTRRPNTADTIYSWLKEKPRPGSVLVISCQPYVRYQQATVESIMPPEFTIDAAGPAVRKNENTAVILDTLARFIYTKVRSS